MPDPTIWNQFPLVAIIVLVVAALGIGVFTFAKWAVKELKEMRDKELTWREAQNAARECAAKEQNQIMQQTIRELADRWEKQDNQRNGTLAIVVEGTTRILEELKRHDERAARIETNTQPRSRAKGT